METHEFFLSLVIILITARVFAELAVRMQTPSVIGELLRPPDGKIGSPTAK